MLQTAWEYLVGVCRDLVGGFALKACGSSAIAVLCGFIGGRDAMVEGLFLLVCLDFGLGMVHGWKEGRLSKAKFMRGLAKFFLYYAAVFGAALLDSICNVKAERLLHVDFRSFLIIYLALHEFISVLGHLEFLGMRLPPKLTDRLKNYRDGRIFSGKGA